MDYQDFTAFSTDSPRREETGFPWVLWKRFFVSAKIWEKIFIDGG